MEINGLKVVDAVRPLAIRITKRDVAAGKTKDPGSCAAARAAVRSGNCTQARVHIARTYLKVDNKWVRYQTPASIRTEIVAFDRGAKFDPGVYVLRPMSPGQRFGRGRAQGSSTGKTKPPRAKKVACIKHHEVAGVRGYGANR